WRTAILRYVLLGFALVLVFSGPPAHAQIYSVFLVPQPSSPTMDIHPTFTASAVNVSGQFAGTYSVCDTVAEQPDVCFENFSLPAISDGPSFFQGVGGNCLLYNPPSGSAFAINAAGQAVGDCYGSALIFTADGNWQQIGATPALGTGGPLPAAINASGQVTGTDVNLSAFLFSAGQLTDLGAFAPGASSSGFGINDAGVIAGTAGTASGDTHAFITNGTTLVDLGTLAGGTTQAGFQSTAYAINNSGQAVGVSSATGGSHAFLYSAGALNDLGTLGGANSTAYSINNSGDIVGTSDLAVSGATHAFLYSGGQLLDLNSLLVPSDASAALTDASFINDNGWILVDHGGSVLVPAVFAPRSLAFGPQLVGTASAAQTIQISTTAHYGFPVTNVTTSGPFSYVSHCPASLPAGSSCTIAVTFEPVVAGAQTGTLFVSGLAVATTGSTLVPAVTLSASTGTPTTGELVTLSWVSSDATACAGIGGAPGDGWAGSRTTNGSTMLTEPAAGTVTYTISCIGGTQSASASATVTYDNPPSSGGGGSVDPAWLLGLLGLLGVRRRSAMAIRAERPAR
ncbi:MAG TPA: choice-of-anchor D domain-containing protein, partial [Steroidobacteraceae bacterium]|nr:choice-of-anchor D domain-containing protein [Steroidobacteraceae bacterium]